jgi:hypothetical protein
VDKSLHIVIGMTIAYLASFLGLILAWVSYVRRRKREDIEGKEEKDEPGDDGASRG